MSGLKFIALIPIRHHSQRIPGKNYRLLGEYPLYYHIIKNLVDCALFHQIIVNTDSPIVSDGIASYFPSVIIQKRDVSLCAPDVSMNHIIESAIKQLEIGLDNREKIVFDDKTVIFQTHCTNPFLSIKAIKMAINNFTRDIPDTLFSVSAHKCRFWSEDGLAINHSPKDLIQTQDLPVLYSENSVIYMFKVNTFKKYHNRVGESLSFIVLPPIESIDIDLEHDFELAEIVYSDKQRKKGWSFNEELEKKIENTEESIPIKCLTTPPKVLDDTKILEALMSLKQKEFPTADFSGRSILISAPYMMSNITAFTDFFNSLGIDVIVADVKERLSEEELTFYSGRYEIALIGDDAFTETIIASEASKALIGLCKWGTGIDSISQEACHQYQISLLNTPDAFTHPVAESILSAILNFTRNTLQQTQMMSYTDQWVKIPCKTLSEISIGIIGYGHIGTRLGQLLEPFGSNVMAYDILEKHGLNGVNIVNSMDDILKCDIICLCCNYTKDNYHLIDTRQISQMKKGTYLINMARGPLINNNILIEYLRTGWLAGIALDVFEIEPLPKQHELRKMPNVILSSHNANSSPKAWMNVHLNTVRNCFKILNDRPPKK